MGMIQRNGYVYVVAAVAVSEQRPRCRGPVRQCGSRSVHVEMGV